MIAPKSTLALNPPASELGNTPVLIFVNDFGSQRLLPFTCGGASCKAGKVTKPAVQPQNAATQPNADTAQQEE